MKRFIKGLLALLLCLPLAGLMEGNLGEEAEVGRDIAFDSILDFYWTLNPPFAISEYQRYRLYKEEGKHFLYHETREGSWPQGEEDITEKGTLELQEEAWEAFCDLLSGGTALVRQEHLEDGDPGPWMYVYFEGGEKDGREFTFATPEKQAAFEQLCESIKEENMMRIRVSDGEHTVVYRLNGSGPAVSLWAMLPMDAEVENYGSNEKIFYPGEKVASDGGIEGGGSAGGLALFSPWGNVVMYYDDFDPYPGLYILGEAEEGTEEVQKLQGFIRVEKVEK